MNAKPASHATKVWFGPAGAEIIGDDVLRRPLFADPEGVTTGVDVTAWMGDFKFQPWQSGIAGLHLRNENQ